VSSVDFYFLKVKFSCTKCKSQEFISQLCNWRCAVLYAIVEIICFYKFTNVKLFITLQ